MGTVRGMALQPDGKVVVCGEFDRVQGSVRHKVARLNADGSIDPTFVPAPERARHRGPVSSGGGGFTTYNGSPAPGIVRLNTDGTIDPAFDPGTGLPTNGSAVDIAVLPDDRIIVVGAFTSYDGVPRNRIARLLADGALDTAFDPGTGLEGQVNIMEGTRAFAVAVQVTGEVTVVGNFTTYDGGVRNGIARISTDGSLDTTFDPGIGRTPPPWHWRSARTVLIVVDRSP
ncbi:MAG: delta-60 repeat domain-containing protein [Flavobacteriales bacterium]|nr:delta-60 repeat domain-containing protein [Flavobacteriales bacterium]